MPASVAKIRRRNGFAMALSRGDVMVRGSGAPSVNAGIGGYFMAAVPTELLGRATSASSLTSMAALPLAPLIAGFEFPLLGWTGLLVFCAAITSLAGIIALTNRPLRTLSCPEGWAARAAAC